MRYFIAFYPLVPQLAETGWSQKPLHMKHRECKSHREDFVAEFGDSCYETDEFVHGTYSGQGIAKYPIHSAPLAQLADALDLGSSVCEFKSHGEYSAVDTASCLSSCVSIVNILDMMDG